jgi:hypothetical protein
MSDGNLQGAGQGPRKIRSVNALFLEREWLNDCRSGFHCWQSIFP